MQLEKPPGHDHAVLLQHCRHAAAVLKSKILFIARMQSTPALARAIVAPDCGQIYLFIL